MATMGTGRLLPWVFVVVGIFLGVRGYWVPGVILIVFAVFGFCLAALYRR